MRIFLLFFLVMQITRSAGTLPKLGPYGNIGEGACTQNLINYTTDTEGKYFKECKYPQTCKQYNKESSTHKKKKKKKKAIKEIKDSTKTPKFNIFKLEIIHKNEKTNKKMKDMTNLSYFSSFNETCEQLAVSNNKAQNIPLATVLEVRIKKNEKVTEKQRILLKEDKGLSRFSENGKIAKAHTTHSAKDAATHTTHSAKDAATHSANGEMHSNTHDTQCAR
eukprot:Phypoly_transcript_03423.p2 GENE.Phypoly_transcript_03423~~Phypoly_transcript_03423.p2  ORF type:complete len:221 (+),score=38.05 Phypoly_transcript_03423:699-1361(+)